MSKKSLSRLSLASLSTAPLLSNFGQPLKTRRSARDSPLLLFEALHEDGMAVKKLSSQLKNCSMLLLLSSPAFPAAVSVAFFTLYWFLGGLVLMIFQVLLGSTGFRVAKKRKIRKVERFVKWLRVYTVLMLGCVLAYQVHAFLALLEQQCKEVELKEVCSWRQLTSAQLLVVCAVPLADLLIAVLLCYVLKVTLCFQRALINDLVGLNAAWQQ